MDDRATSVTCNVALRVRPPDRPRTTARAYTPEQPEELWNAVFTCGLADPELAMLLFWWHLETGARRGGALHLEVGDLDLARQYARLLEKFAKVDDQPISIELQRAILSHALERVDVVLSTADGLCAEEVTVDDVLDGRATLRPDAPAFYYQRRRKVTRPDGSFALEPHPLMPRAYNTIWDRICAHVPCADSLHARPHDLRKTEVVWIERALGFSVARAWLGHQADDHTLTYTAAADEEVLLGFEMLTGRTHPHAQPALRDRGSGSG